jgi:sulfite reductase (NADPH) flavoprotein alpha-component
MKYTRQNPYYSYLKDRCLLNKGSTKKTYHISLEINSNELDFKVGDSIGVIPLNDIKLIKKTLKNLKINQPNDLEITALNKVNICTGTKKLILKIKDNLKNSTLLTSLEKILLNKDTLDKYLNSRHVWQILEEFPSDITLDDTCLNLRTMLPRFYSIASSKNFVKNEMHLLVTENTYHLQNTICYGIGSNYLCNLAKINDPIAIYVQKSPYFTLPVDEETPIIMIGPGTGLAPFRAFLQDRCLNKTISLKNWLFFGERNKNYDFYYQNFLEEIQVRNQLKLNVAFSRDQDKKIYVQDLIKKNGNEFFQWIRDGAIIYICGDAKQMAKAVEKTILKVFQDAGKMSDNEAGIYLKMLRKNKRYLCDVY